MPNLDPLFRQTGGVGATDTVSRITADRAAGRSVGGYFLFDAWDRVWTGPEAAIASNSYTCLTGFGHEDFGVTGNLIVRPKAYPLGIIAGGSAATGPDFEAAWSSLRKVVEELFAVGTFEIERTEVADHHPVPFRSRSRISVAIEKKGRAPVLPFFIDEE